jgi:hypothetical protein
MATVNIDVLVRVGGANATPLSTPFNVSFAAAQLTLGTGDKLQIINTYDGSQFVSAQTQNQGIVAARELYAVKINSAGVASTPFLLGGGMGISGGPDIETYSFAQLPNGGYVFAWDFHAWSGLSAGVYTRFLDSSGDPITAQIQLGQSNNGNSANPWQGGLGGLQVTSSSEVQVGWNQDGFARWANVTLGNDSVVVTSQNESLSYTYQGQPLSPQPICFLIGTHIEADHGLVAIQEINREIRISTFKSLTEVAWIGYQRRTPEFAAFQDYLPVKISAGSVDDNVPIRDLYLSPDHAVLIDGHLIHAKALVNGKTIVQMTEWEGDIEYYHIETEKHEIIFAEGLPCETFIDNVSRAQFDNYAEYLELYPYTRAMRELPLPRVRHRRQVPSAIWDRLSKRADKRLKKQKR